jgi:hypothetical protein
MNNRWNSLRTAMACVCFGSVTNIAAAGPFVDWWLNNRTPAPTPVTVGYPVAPIATYPQVPSTQVVGPLPYANVPYSPTLNATTLPSYPSGSYTAGYVPIPQSVVGVLPTGSYQTTLNNVPTTYYRPVTSLDPATGTTVTTLQPCTSYQQQVLRTPLLNPVQNSYYAAYGSYGAGLPQDRFSPVTGAGVATAAQQSSLSIPSATSLKTFSSLQQLPVSGMQIPVNANPVVSAYSTTPTQVITQLPSIPNYGSNSVVTSNGQVTLNYAPQASSNSIVQADGTIVTPLGSSGMLTPAPTYNAPATYNSAPSYNAAPVYGNPTITQPNSGVISQPHTSSYSTIGPNDVTTSSSYAPSTSYAPSSSYAPASTTNPALNGSSNYNVPNYSNQFQSPANVVPNDQYRPLADPMSIVPPSLAPSNDFSQSGSRGIGKLDPIDGVDRMVEIDRPRSSDRRAAQFTRSPVYTNDEAAFVSDSRSMEAPAYGTGEVNTSITPPALLAPEDPSEHFEGVRPPAGYQPKPYWRSEQKSADPNALFNKDDKTASQDRLIVKASAK